MTKVELLDGLLDAIASRVVEAMKGTTSAVGPAWLGKRDVPAGCWPSVRDAIKRGELKGAHVGRGLFVARADFDAWMRSRAEAHAAQLGGAAVDEDDPVELAIASGKLRRIGGAR